MARGRKKDLTIPPSRSLTQQRDYRARKAQYVSELEERCRKAEEEIVRLRMELEIARAAGPPTLSNEMDILQILASSDLAHQLAAASESIARFQHLATNKSPASGPSPDSTSKRKPPSSSPLKMAGLRPTFLSSELTPSHLLSLTSLKPQHTVPVAHPSSAPSTSINYQIDAALQRCTPSPTPSIGSECCGGLIDCTGLILDEEEEQERQRNANRVPTSELRTSPSRSREAPTMHCSFGQVPRCC